jgi:hypothetical protein
MDRPFFELLQLEFLTRIPDFWNHKKESHWHHLKTTSFCGSCGSPLRAVEGSGGIIPPHHHHYPQLVFEIVTTHLAFAS